MKKSELEGYWKGRLYAQRALAGSIEKISDDLYELAEEIAADFSQYESAEALIGVLRIAKIARLLARKTRSELMFEEIENDKDDES